MKLLVISPDYASHYLPMSAVAAAAAARGADVVVATGDAMRERVERDGHRWRPLRMSVGSNAGLRPTTTVDDDLAPFIDATRHGMVATLAHQAEARAHDLLHDPSRVAADTTAVVADVHPDAVLVDHLSLAARIGLRTLGVPVATFVPGHPSQLPVAGECYGFPVAWPRWVEPASDELAALRARCAVIERSLATQVGTVGDVFGAHGATVLYNSPGELHDPGRTGLPTRHHFLGSCVRAAQPVDGAVAAWLADGEPFVYVSLGTFLSARGDVLSRVAAALRRSGRRVAMATGTTDPAALGDIPDAWLVRSVLPQVELIADADLVVCHGGNNTVTEALTAGRPLLVLPLSTDQFAIAADLERTRCGASVDPNSAAVEPIVEAIAHLDAARGNATAIGAALRARPGPERAVDVLLDMAGRSCSTGSAGAGKVAARR